MSARPPSRERALQERNQRRERRETQRGQPSAGLSAQAACSNYECIALVLQGGGALGGYQGGVYEALHEAGLRPDWLAGVSIGAINAAIIAGNAPEQRVAQLHGFWDTISHPTGMQAWPWTSINQAYAALPTSDALRGWLGANGAVNALLHGQQGFFAPRLLPPFLLSDGSAAATSFYDTSALRDTLLRYVDFDRINAGETRLSIGAVNIRSGNVVYFDSAKMQIRPEHVMASGALPPAFPAVEIDGEYYWDGGVVSNTPLQYVQADQPRRDTLALQVDLWSARGDLPATLSDVFERQKDIQYSSRTRLTTDMVARLQKLRAALTELLDRVDIDELPEGLLDDVQPWICDRVLNVIHLIYRSKSHEQQYKDYSFAPTTLRDHWQSGIEDMKKTLEHQDYFKKPAREVGVTTHDVHRDEILGLISR